jgi:hypothetical protein
MRLLLVPMIRRVLRSAWAGGPCRPYFEFASPGDPDALVATLHTYLVLVLVLAAALLLGLSPEARAWQALDDDSSTAEFAVDRSDELPVSLEAGGLAEVDAGVDLLELSLEELLDQDMVVVELEKAYKVTLQVGAHSSLASAQREASD